MTKHIDNENESKYDYIIKLLHKINENVTKDHVNVIETTDVQQIKAEYNRKVYTIEKQHEQEMLNLKKQLQQQKYCCLVQ
jgi:hemerythrin-like domain-containing protein